MVISLVVPAGRSLDFHHRPRKLLLPAPLAYTYQERGVAKRMVQRA